MSTAPGARREEGRRRHSPPPPSLFGGRPGASRSARRARRRRPTDGGRRSRRSRLERPQQRCAARRARRVVPRPARQDGAPTRAARSSTSVATPPATERRSPRSRSPSTASATRSCSARRARRLAPDVGADPRRRRRRAVELGRYDAAFATYDASRAQARPRRVRARRVRARADRRPRRRSTRWSSPSTRRRPGEPTAWAHVELGEAPLRPGRARAARARAPRGARGASRATSTRSRASRGSRPRAAGRPRRSRSPAARPSAAPLPQFVVTLGDLSPSPAGARRAPSSTAARRDRAPAARRAASAPSSSRRSSTSTTASGCATRSRGAARARRAAEHPGGRRPRLGARRATGRCDGGARLRAAGASARHARRARALPPRDGRALRSAATPPRRAGSGARSRSTRTSRCVWAPVARRYAGEARPRSLLALLALALPATAAAHPLGNFTINRYTGIELSGDRLYVHYVLDLAEIPSAQEGDRVRAARLRGRARAPARACALDGAGVPLGPLDAVVRARPGAAGLETLRFEAVYEARARGPRARVPRRELRGRRGWREVVVRAERGRAARVLDVPATSSAARCGVPSSARRAARRRARQQLPTVPGSRAGVPPALGERGPADRATRAASRSSRRPLARLRRRLARCSPLFWGAAHALEPGHGKAIVAGYLVGTRGRPRDALLLGAIVTATHTVGVFALGLVTLGLSRVLVPEQLYPWLNLVAGAPRRRRRCRRPALRPHRARAHAPAQAHGHHHRPHHELSRRGPARRRDLGRDHPLPDRARRPARRDLAAPRRLTGWCSSSRSASASPRRSPASASSPSRPGGASRALGFDGRLVRALPAVSALVVVALGLAMTVRALATLA